MFSNIQILKTSTIVTWYSKELVFKIAILASIISEYLCCLHELSSDYNVVI